MNRHMISYLSIACVLFTTVFTQYTSDNQRDALQTIIEELKKELRFDMPNSEPKILNKLDMPSITIPDTVQSPNGNIRVLDPVGSLPVPSFPAANQYRGQASPLLSAILNSKNDNDKQDIGIDKRQGRWDFDYGLGGGRFGKRSRMFADYSLGGGRFGRDTDHVLELDDVTDYDYNNGD